MDQDKEHGFAAWDDKSKLFRVSFKGGLANKNRHKFSSEKAREAVKKRWDRVRAEKLNSDVVQF